MMLGLVLISLVTNAATYHVAPGGNDRASGAINSPVATIAQAVKLADSGDVVLVHEGEYRIDAPIMIGADKARLLIKASGKVVLRGGIKVPQSSVIAPDDDVKRRLTRYASENVQQVDLRDMGIYRIDQIVARGFPHGRAMAPVELFVNDDAQTLARWPNEGFVQTGTMVVKGSIPREGDTSGKKPTFEFPRGRVDRWQTLEDVWAYGYWHWDWADESILVESYRDGKLTLTKPHHYGVSADRSIYFENVLEELDSPGEYYIDRKNLRLFFWPSSDGDVHLSLYRKPMIRITDAVDVTIEGLRFETSREVPVQVTGGRNVVVRSCVFRNLGLSAVSMRGGTKHRVEQCRFSDLGAGGVNVSGGDRNRLVPAGHEVADSVFENFSRLARTYRPGVSIGGVGVRVTRCEFSSAPHSAIIYSGNDHTIDRNYFHDLLAPTGDGGAIYAGRDWSARGTVIKENLFQNVNGKHLYENSVYLDDQLSGIKVLDNVFIDCFWGVLVGGGRDNEVRGNLFVDVKRSLHLDARGLGWASHLFDTLKERLQSVPYASTKWKRRYPGIESTLNDDPMSPKGNIVTDNVLVRSGRDTNSLAPEFRSGSTVVRNTSSDSRAKFTVRNGVLTMDRQAVELLSRINGFNSPRGRKFGPTANVPEID